MRPSDVEYFLAGNAGAFSLWNASNHDFFWWLFDLVVMAGALYAGKYLDGQERKPRRRRK
jgi:hypothetical protein